MSARLIAEAVEVSLDCQRNFDTKYARWTDYGRAAKVINELLEYISELEDNFIPITNDEGFE